MNTDRIYDYAVVGAGGSGMLLLLAFHQAGLLTGKRVIVFEPSQHKGNDRTWCFWATPDDEIVHALQSVIDASWQIVNTPAGNKKIDPYRYHHVRSEPFYAYVRQQLAVYEGIDWSEEAVQAIHEMPEGNELIAGHTYRATKVFDSRLNEAQRSFLQREDGVLWQSFAGYRIRLKERFANPQVMEMMDFSIHQKGQCQFMYVLPFSGEHLLVEMTRFGRQRLSMAEAAPELQSYIADNWGAYEIEEEETGCIPMSLELGKMALPPREGYVPVGTAAGAVKATTGYAFYTMFRHSRALAAAEQQAGESLPVIPRKSRFAFYDALLLHILNHHPAQGSGIFTRLLQRIPPPQVFRFLQEQSSAAEEISILASLPKYPFLRALAESVLSRLVALSGRTGILLVVALFLLIIQQVLPDYGMVISQVLLAVGLLFPGIPHGALDHVLTMPTRQLSWRMLPFVGGYLGIMAVVAAVWWLMPVVGLLLFLAYSAWHFGETDYREWRTYSPVAAILHGMGLLLFLLGTHWNELSPYLQMYGLQELSGSGYTAIFCTCSGAFGLLISGMELPATSRPGWIRLMCVLLVGAFLPILTAFALYFIGHHSFNGWQHIRQAHQFSHRQMLLKALPFSSMALLFFLLFGALFITNGEVADSVWPVFFIFLAAVSAPHIWYMHRFYRTTAIDGKA